MLKHVTAFISKSGLSLDVVLTTWPCLAPLNDSRDTVSLDEDEANSSIARRHQKHADEVQEIKGMNDLLPAGLGGRSSAVRVG